MIWIPSCCGRAVMCPGHRTRSAIAMLGLLMIKTLPVYASPEFLEHMGPRSRQAGLRAIPDDDVIELHRARHVSIEESGERRIEMMRIFHIRSGDGGNAAQWSIVADHYTEFEEMKAWHVDANGDLDVIETVVTSQIFPGAVYIDAQRRGMFVTGTGPGSTIAYYVRVKEKLRELASDRWPGEDGWPVLSWEYRLELPPSWAHSAYWAEDGAATPFAGRASSESTGAYLWQRRRIPAGEEVETGAAPDENVAPVLLVSMTAPTGRAGSMHSWPAVSRWFQEIGESALENETAIEEIISAIPGPVPPSRAGLRLIADHIKSSIAYEQIYLDDGGWRPHPVEEVYRNHYGDCKDMSFLALGLCRTVGLEAFPVLTGAHLLARSRLHVPGPYFDHCILAVRDPERTRDLLFVDLTAKTIPLGRLPSALEGSLALVVGEGYDSDLIRLPESTASDNQWDIRIVLQLSSDLGATGCVDEVRTGHLAYGLNDDSTSRKTEAIKRAIEERFERHFANGTIDSLRIEMLSLHGDTMHLEYDFSTPIIGSKMGSILCPRLNFISAKDRALFDQSARTRDVFYPYAYQIRTEVIAALPPGWEVEELPHDIQIENSFAKYGLRWEEAPGGVRMYRTEAVIRRNLPVEEYQLAREWSTWMARGDRERIVIHCPN